MNLRAVLVVVVLGLLATFTFVNWQTFVEPTTLDLLVARVEAPLGLVMLGFTLLLVVVLLAYAFKVQFQALAEARRQSEELRRQRELADRAEASRFTELRGHLDEQLAGLRESQLEAGERLRRELADAANSLAASIGELDERIERALPTPPERMP